MNERMTKWRWLFLGLVITHTMTDGLEKKLFEREKIFWTEKIFGYLVEELLEYHLYRDLFGNIYIWCFGMRCRQHSRLKASSLSMSISQWTVGRCWRSKPSSHGCLSALLCCSDPALPLLKYFWPAGANYFWLFTSNTFHNMSACCPVRNWQCQCYCKTNVRPPQWFLIN